MDVRAGMRAASWVSNFVLLLALLREEDVLGSAEAVADGDGVEAMVGLMGSPAWEMAADRHFRTSTRGQGLLTSSVSMASPVASGFGGDAAVDGSVEEVVVPEEVEDLSACVVTCLVHASRSWAETCRVGVVGVLRRMVATGVWDWDGVGQCFRHRWTVGWCWWVGDV